jgi:hypothetical protein
MNPIALNHYKEYLSKVNQSNKSTIMEIYKKFDKCLEPIVILCSVLFEKGCTTHGICSYSWKFFYYKLHTLFSIKSQNDLGLDRLDDSDPIHQSAPYLLLLTKIKYRCVFKNSMFFYSFLRYTF